MRSPSFMVVDDIEAFDRALDEVSPEAAGAAIKLMVKTFIRGKAFADDDRAARALHMQARRLGRVKDQFGELFAMAAEIVTKARQRLECRAKSEETSEKPAKNENLRPKTPTKSNPAATDRRQETEKDTRTNVSTSPDMQRTTHTLAEPAEAPVRPERVSREFDEFWKVYPLKVKRARAQQAWWRARHKASKETILAGVERYCRTKPEWQQWAHPDAWLAAERWADEVPRRPDSRPAAPSPMPPRELSEAEQQAQATAAAEWQEKVQLIKELDDFLAANRLGRLDIEGLRRASLAQVRAIAARYGGFGRAA
jgi:uncharacterized protein YdaU (DUF1376 family)